MTGLIAHEWLEAVGGAERVVDAWATEFSDAPVVVPWDDRTERWAPGREHEAWLARTPLRRHKALSMPFLLSWWRHLPVDTDPDWMLCGSHLFAHHARVHGRDVPKYVYTYSPARYIWNPDVDDRGDSAAVRTLAGPLQRIDRRRAQEAVKIAAVSRYIADRVEHCWGRESTVIHPPVDVSSFPGSDDELTADELAVADALPSDFVLGASRFVPYKRLDVVIDAGAAADLPVVLAGSGPGRDRLTALADEHPGRVTIIDRPSDALLRALYRRALVYVFAPVEDFGIMPVEAMAAGTPVVGNAVGGAAETVAEGATGALLHGLDAHSLREAVDAAARCAPDACRARAASFDGTAFGTRIREWMGV
jgi:glycosyltransferase involved in cell wall biosynthesis